MPKNTISVKTGEEGPSWDPYHYSEVTIEGRNGTITYHGGALVSWVSQNGTRVAVDGMADYELFEQLTGVEPRVAEGVYYKAASRRIARHPCGHKHLTWQAGYPGESVLVCTKCNTMLDYDFDESAVI